MPGGVWLLSSDLMAISSVGGAAAQAGLVLNTVSSVDQLAGGLEASDLILIDFETPGLNLREVAANLSHEQVRRSIVYGPHVHAERFAEARAAGFVNVLARGRFLSEVGGQLRGYAAEFASGPVE